MSLETPVAFADQSLTRACGAPRVPGNRVRLLKDATENYPAWIEAIESAEQWIHFETYIIHEDDTGRHFADLLSAKARQGVKVRLIYDWVGSLRNASGHFWRTLAAAGVDVRSFNRPSLRSPFGWANRDHRKLLSVDGRIAYISGLCVGQPWVGDPGRGVEPWRDTGVEIEGPALADIERAFANTWAVVGKALPAHEQRVATPKPGTGDVAVRIVASLPNVGSVYRIDQLITMLASKSIWLADAYFAGTASYVQALQSAARSGVDVRLLMPGTNDVPIMRAVSRASLRSLLEAGVRVFEWNGSMMHAKTAVADGVWARVGSTNLNVVSWLANWELDVVVEDQHFAKQMEAMFLDDLSHATEIVLDKRRRPAAISTPRHRTVGGKGAGVSRTAAGVMRLSHSLGAAITHRRELGPAEAVIMFWGAALLVTFSAVAVYWPRAVAVPAAILGVWIATALVARAWKLRRKRTHGKHARP